MNARALRALAAAAATVVLLTGCGSAEEDAAAPGVVPTHAAEAGEPALPTVPGYTYSDLAGADAKDLNAIQKEMDAVNEELPGAFVAVAAHNVTGPSGEEVGVFELKVGPALTEDPETLQALTAGFAAGMVSEGLTVRMGTMGGVDVAQGTDDQGWAACSWSQGDLVFLVFGEDEDAVNDYAAAVIKACQSK